MSTLFDAPTADALASALEDGKSATVFVPGKPVQQGSKKGFYNPKLGRVMIVEDSKQTGPWRERIALAVYNANVAIIERGIAVAVRIEFVMPRPVSTPKRRTPRAVKKPDVDKLIRGVLDALTGIAYRDDSQVIDLAATKRLAELKETPGAHITWTEIA